LVGQKKAVLIRQKREKEDLPKSLSSVFNGFKNGGINES
jgi:hypothetical protein